MPKILVGGAGGAPSENVIRSLLESGDGDEVIGMGSEPSDLICSSAKRKYLVPYAYEKSYKDTLNKLLKREKPDLIHFQHDIEILEASKLRAGILKTGVKLFMPCHATIDNCVHKDKSYAIWKAQGVRVPRTILIETAQDLKKAFKALGNKNGLIWLRATVGGAGKWSLPVKSFKFAKEWIGHFNGWGRFTAAEILTARTVTWLSIWYEGDLVVAQARRRKSWQFGDRAISGVTGITKVGETYSSAAVDRIAQDAILAIDKNPHGIYGVDMAYDNNNFPNPTEINIARFFTTVYFFTKAGLNMPKIYKDIALYNKFPSLKRKINPLPDGLLWVRGMDREPLLLRKNDMEKRLIKL